VIDPDSHESGGPDISPRTLRQFAALGVAILAAVFGLSWYRHGAPTAAAWSLLVIAVAVGIPGFARPALIRPVFLTAVAVTRPIGRVVNLVLLGALYFGLITPLAMLFRAMGRDVLRRRRPTVATYWVPRTTTTDVSQYLRQYQKS
jgi:hypothetical protein